MIEPRPQWRRRWSVVSAAAVIVVAGCALGCGQGVFIGEGLSYCLNADVVLDDPGPRLAAAFEQVMRLCGYGVALSVMAAPFLVLAVRTGRRRWTAVALAAAAVCGVVLFIVDYTRSNDIEFHAKADGIVEQVSQRCPGFRPPWWPF